MTTSSVDGQPTTYGCCRGLLKETGRRGDGGDGGDGRSGKPRVAGRRSQPRARSRDSFLDEENRIRTIALKLSSVTSGN